jgi:hypothetical protein
VEEQSLSSADNATDQCDLKAELLSKFWCNPKELSSLR